MFHRPRRTARTLGIVIVTLLVTQVLVASPASAGTLFNMSGDVYYLSGGVKTVGWPIVSESTNSQPNAWATAFAYRSNVIGDATNRTSESNAPTTHHIYQPWRPVDGPAYTLWDVGSSAWGNQSVVGDTPVVVAMTTAGVNGWTGPTWVSGTRTTVTIAMVGNSQADFADAQMEQIPTPAYIGATTSSVTIGWTDLLDAGHTAQGTSTVVPSAKSIVGYSLYRSVNGGAFTMLPDGSFTAQNAGAATTYTDSAVVPGSTYQYHLGVRFEWTAETPPYYEPPGVGPNSVAVGPGLPTPVMIKILPATVSTAAGTKSAVMTATTSDATGNTGLAVASDTQLNLTSNSTGANKKFYSVSGGVCTATVVTFVTVLSGASTAQFCYSDEKASPTSWTLTATDNAGVLTAGTTAATVTAATALSTLTLSLVNAQANRTTFTGTNTLTAKDVYGNTMTAFSAATNAVTFTVAPGTATVGGLAGAGTAQLIGSGDFVNGVATLAGKLKLSGATGSYTVTASAASILSNGAPVTLGAAGLDHFDFALATPQVVDATFTGANTLTARDVDNNILTGFNAAATNVTVIESGSSGTVAGLGAGNVINGAGSFIAGVADLTALGMTYTGTVGAHTFRATSGSVNTTSNSVAFTFGALSKFALALNTPQANAAPFSAATVTAQDVAGNTVTSFDGSDNVTITVAGGGVVVPSGLAAGSFTNGVATMSGVFTYTGASGSHVFTVTSLSGKTGTATVVVNPGALTTLALGLVSAQANRAAFSGTNTLTAKDTSGNTITTFSASANNVTFAVAPGTATVGGLAGVGGAQLIGLGDFSGGVATLTTKLMLTGTAGSYTVSASAAGVTSNAAPVTLSAGILDHFVFALATPQSIAAGFTGVNSLTAEDQDNNVLTGFNAATTPVTVIESVGTGTVSGFGAGNVINGAGSFVSGVANLAGLMKYTGLVGVHAFKATSGSVNTTSNNVTFTPGVLSKFAVTLNSPQVNDASFASATVTAQDVAGNTVTSFDGSDNVTMSVAGGGVVAPSVLNAANFTSGVATLNGVFKFTGPVGSHLFTATSGTGKTGTATVSITAGAIASVKVVNGATIAATEVTTSALTSDQTLPLWSAGYDVSGNWTGLVAGSWSSGGTLAPAVTNAAVNAIVFNPSIAPASGVISVAFGGFNDSTDTVTVTNGAQTKFVLTAPATATAGTSFNLPQIQAQDADGNTVVGYTGSQVLVFSGPANAPNATPPSYPLSVSFTAGTATNIPVTLVKAETVKLTVTQSGHNGVSADIVVSAAPATTFKVVAPAAAVAGIPFDIALTALDAVGNTDLAYAGAHTIVFTGPAKSPNLQSPTYPASVSFTTGSGTANVTLVKREAAIVTATEGSLTAPSGTIAVGAAAGAVVVATGGNNQNGAVAQALLINPQVDVKDAFGNEKNGFSVGFAVTAGAGSVNVATVVTDVNGKAAVIWTLGATAGTNNNTLAATASGLTGSPVVFTASGVGNHFDIVIPGGVTAGVPFSPTIRMVDTNDVNISTYTGTKTVVFSGPSSTSAGVAPTYPLTITFSSGVPTTSTSMTLVVAETTTLKLKEGTVSGTVSVTVAVGTPTQLAFTSPAQTITVDVAGDAISVCLEDQYGNSALSGADRQVAVTTTSRDGEFSLTSASTGAWGIGTVTLDLGESCVVYFYRDHDPHPGVNKLLADSAGLAGTSQDFTMLATGETTTTIAPPPPGTPAALRFITPPPTVPAGSTSSVLTVKSTDAVGSVTPVAGDTTVELSSDSTGGSSVKFFLADAGVCTTTETTSVLMGAGTSTAQFCYSDQRAGSWTLTAADPVTPLASGSLDVIVTSSANIGSLTLLLANAQKSGAAFAGTNFVAAKDEFGNTMTNFSAAANAVTFTVDPTATIGGLNGAGSAQLVAAGDFSKGVATLVGRLKLNGKVGTYSVTATVGSVSSNPAGVTLAAGALDHFAFELAGPQSIATPFVGTNTLTAEDADNNVVTSFNAADTPVHVTEVADNGAVSGLGTDNVLRDAAAFTNGTADLSSAMTYIGSSGVHSFRASIGTPAIGTSNEVTFVAGPLQKFAVSLNTPQVNDSPFTTATITAQDVAGNTITSFDAGADAVTIDVTGAGSVAPSGLTFAGGIASPNALTYTGPVGSQVFTVTSESGKKGTASAVITAGSTVAVRVVNGPTATATPVSARALTADQNLQLWSAGFDVSGNWTGLVNTTWSSTGSLAPAVTAVGVNSIVFEPTLAPASGTIVASTAPAADETSDSTGLITITNGALTSFVVHAPATATSSKQFELSLVQATDADGNVVVGYEGLQVLAFSGPGDAPDGTQPSYPSTVSFVAGIATDVPVTLFRAETVKLHVSLDGIAGDSGDIVVSGAGAATGMSVTAPSLATAGIPFVVTVKALDIVGNVDPAFTGDHVVSFTGPSNSPAPIVAQPAYPSSLSFSSGVATSDVTLFKREASLLTATLTATPAFSATSGIIGVAAGPADLIAASAGAADQQGAVQQDVPVRPEVVVTDVFANEKDGYDHVSFATVAVGTSARGTVDSPSVVTTDSGHALTAWTLGPDAALDNSDMNNQMEATALQADGTTPLKGSPVTFKASAAAIHFDIVIPNGVTAGMPFEPDIRLVNAGGQLITTYSGDKTVQFSGPSVSGPIAPQYPGTLHFVNGVADPASMTLYVAESTVLSMSDVNTKVIGTANITIAVGVAAQLAFSTPVRTIKARTVSAVLTICLQDTYGNLALAAGDVRITLMSRDPGGAFSAVSNGNDKANFVTLPDGLGCVDFYYRDIDGPVGTRNLQVGSTNLTPATQAIVVAVNPIPPTTTTTATTTTSTTVPRPGNTTSPSTAPAATIPVTTPANPGGGNGGNGGAGGGGGSGGSVTVYPDEPTRSPDQPAPGPTIQVPIPSSVRPEITSPRQGALIVPIDGIIEVTGTGPPNEPVTLVSGSSQLIDATTTDAQGNWQMLVASSRLSGSDPHLHAALGNGLTSSTIDFSLRKLSFLERILNFFG